MATITSVTNFTGSKQWSDTSAWQGGIVPTTSDIAQVRGVRTTVNKSGGYTYWTGSQSFIVASTTGFPNSGSFYCATDRDQKIKIDYESITNSTTFGTCTVDTSYFAWGTSSLSSSFDRIYGGTIPNSTYVLYQPVIEITGSVITGEIRIEQGGYIKIYDSGSLSFQTDLIVRDGTLHVSESGEILFGLNNTSAASGFTNRIYSENWQMGQILFEGKEERLNTFLTQDVSINDGKLYVNNTSSFEVNDFIIVKDPNATLLRIDDGWGSDQNYSLDLTGSFDECFNVVGKSGSALLISRMNSIDVPILATSSFNPKELIVDSTRLNQGESVVINNEVYTITSVQDYDFEVRNYDFRNGTTTLEDWDTDVSRSLYFSDFQISSSPVSGSDYAMIQHTSTADRFLFIKDIMRQEVKIEAWISNYRNVTSGTSDGGDLGIVIHADPAMDYDIRFNGDSGNAVDSTTPFARTSFVVDADSSRYNLRQRAVTNDTNHSLTLAGISLNGLKKYTLDCRKGIIKAYLDDILVSECFMQQGGYYGRVGVTCYTQNSFTCLQFKVYYPSQKIILDKNISANPGDLVYETGAEFTHKAGNIVLKQASYIEDGLGHSNLAYCYRGSGNYSGDSIFPYIWNAQSNNTTNYTRNNSTVFYNMINNQSVYDITSYNFASNSTTTGSMIVDLGTQRAFTHVTFQEYFRVQDQKFSTSGYIQINTSNDLINWTQSLSPYNDTRLRGSSDAIRIYELGSPQNNRYVQFIRAGANDISTVENRWTSIGVRNYSDGYKLKLNNVSDFNIGDNIIIAYDGGYVNYIAETSYYSNLINGTVPSGSWLTQLKDYYTITDKDSINKTVTLDRPFIHGFLSKGNRVYKINRPIKIRGEKGTNTWKTGRFSIETGYSNGRHISIKNSEFTDLSSNYPTNLSTSYSYAGFGHRNYKIHRSDNFEGIVIHSCNIQASSYTALFNFSGGSVFIRDNLFSGFNGRGWWTYSPSYLGTAYVCGNHIVMSTMNENYFLVGYTDVYFNYNSFISNQTAYGIQIATYGNANSYFQKSYKIKMIRNYFNGGTSHGYRFNQYNAFGNKYYWDVRDNAFEYMDDGISSNIGLIEQPIKRLVLPKKGNTDNRLTRYIQAGIFNSDNYVLSHVAKNHYENYNNWEYNICNNSYTYFLKYPDENYYRAYRQLTTNRLAIFGTTFNIQSDIVTGSFDLSFDYFHSFGQIVLTQNTYTGSLNLVAVKNGVRFSDIILSKPSQLTNFSTTLNFSGSGDYQIGILQSVNSGYVAFANMYNRLSFTNQNEVSIQSNTFDLRQLKSPYPREYTQFEGYSKNKSGGNNIIRLAGSKLK